VSLRGCRPADRDRGKAEDRFVHSTEVGRLFRRAANGSRRGRTVNRWHLHAETLERRLAPAVATPFTVRFTTNDTGDITFAANTLMTAPATPDGDNARNGVGTELNNNDFDMVYVDIDADPTTFNSSAAGLVMPAGSQVLFAGLYWSGRTNSSYPTGLTSQRNNLLFRGPDDTDYAPLTGTTIGTTSSSYQAFKDVTATVAAQGAGVYTIANVQAIAETNDKYAGWSLVVAYRAPGEPARNLTVFDGYGSVSSSDPDVTLSIAGFKAPPSGPVNATLGFIAYEGDLGYKGDQVFFDGGLGPVRLSNPANPANNFFNSTISNLGSLVSTKDPNDVNQLGFDADLVAANGVIANSATSATIRLTTSDETYYPGVVTSAIELFAPEVEVVKTVLDVNGGDVEAGDVLRYTVTVSNAADALDAAVNVLLTDVIPAFTTYRPGSLVVSAGPNAGPKTDAADGDQGEFLGGSAAVRFQLGSGAGGAGTSGGRLAPGESTTITFEVVVNAGIPAATLIENVANVTYTGQTSGFNLTATDFANIATPDFVDLAVTKTDGQTQYVPGTTSTYTIVVTNQGPAAATGVRVVDVMPAEFVAPTWTAVYADGTGPASGAGDIDELVDLDAGGTATFTVTASIRAEAFGDITNTVVVTPPDGLPDPDPTNNVAADTNTYLGAAALAVTKSVRDVNGGVVVAGDVLRYTITVSNPATSPAEAAANVILDDVIPANTTYRPGSLVITSGPNAGAKTDAVDGDQGEFLSGVNAIRFQLGTGAGAGTAVPVGGTLAAGQTTTVTFEVTVNTGIVPSTVITNTATATGVGSVSGLPLTGSDSVGIATPTAADLRIVKQSAAEFVAGTRVTYVLVVANAGPSAVTGATVTDVLPGGLSNATWTATYAGGGSGPASGTGGVNASVNLPVGGQARFTIQADADAALLAPGTITNTATVQNPGGVPDPNPDDNTATVVTDVRAVTDLSVTKTDGRTQYVPGSPVTYTIVVTNSGPSFARQVSVVDTLDPAIVSSAAWTAVFAGAGSAGAPAGTGSLGEIIDLAAGGTATYTIVAQTLPTATGSLVNTVVVQPSNLSNDPNPGNNTATDTDTVLLPAALDVVKSVADLNGDFVVAGDTLRYTIVVSNPAGSPAREAAIDVTLADLIPANTTYAGNLTTTQGSVAGSQGSGVSGTLGTIAAGQSATITFEVTVDAGTPAGTVITNTATAAGTGQTSGQSLTGTGSVGVVTPPGADLSLVKSGPATFVPGSPLTWTIVVSNAGPSTSTNATVQDTLPAGVTAASWTAVIAGGASVADASGSGDVATSVTLPAGGTVTFTVVAQTDPAATAALVNTATVTPTDGLPDPNSDDQTSTITTTPVPTADLSIVKSDGSTTYVPGRSVTYTITVSNAGPSGVTGARVRDVLPGIVTTASWTAAFSGGAGATSGTGGIDELIDLAPGGKAEYTLVAIVSSTAVTSLVNTATVTPPDGVIDPNPGNETATDVDTPDFTPAIVVAPDIGCDSAPLVRVLDPVTGAVRTQFYAYEPRFRGGVRVFGADLTGDGIPEIITAPGPGRPGLVKVFTQDGAELPAYRTFPFGPGFTGGVEVAAGDVTGDGKMDLVAAQGSQGSLVRTFTVTPGAADPVANTPARQIQPFGPKFRGGARVTTADLGRFAGQTFVSAAPDGIAELVVGSGPGIRATVNTYNAVPAPAVLVNSVRPIAPSYDRGVGVATLPASSGAADRVLVTAGTAGGSKVETYGGVGKVPVASFAAFGGAGARAAVWSAALDEANIFSVQGTGGKTSGVRKNTAPSGGASSTLAGSTGLPAPMRIGVLRTVR